MGEVHIRYQMGNEKERIQEVILMLENSNIRFTDRLFFGYEYPELLNEIMKDIKIGDSEMNRKTQ